MESSLSIEDLLSKGLPEATAIIKESGDALTAMSYLAGGDMGIDYPWVEAKGELLQKHEPDDVELFYEHFSTSEARDCRIKCCRNQVLVKNKEAVAIYLAAMDAFKDLSENAQPSNDACEWVGYRIINLIKSGKHDVIKKLSSIVEDADFSKEPGDMTSMVWEEFSKYFISELRLPTKAELRSICGMNDRDEKRSFIRSQNKLGLGGLPESK